jgi:hypothetical protein
MSSLEALFCPVDDGCRVFEPKLEQTRLCPDNKAHKRGKILTLSEIMTILIAFHQNHYRNFKPTFRTSSYIFIYFYIPQDVLTKNCHCRNYY